MKQRNRKTNTNTTGSSISSPRHNSRRRSTVLMNLALNNPSVPAPGEMVHEPHAQTAGSDASPRLGAAGGAGVGDPHHLRNPSLGEIHQELENEQEAQVVSTPFPSLLMLWRWLGLEGGESGGMIEGTKANVTTRRTASSK